MIKKLALSGLVGLLFFLLSGWANQLPPIKKLLNVRHVSQITILSYGLIRDVDQNADFSTRYRHVAPAHFDQQINYLKSNQYEIIDIATYQKITAGESPAPARAVLVTFRDGYEEIATGALPIIKKYHIPATLFWDKQNLGKKGYLSQEQLTELEKHQLTVAPGQVRTQQFSDHEQEVSGIVPIAQFANYLPQQYVFDTAQLAILATLIAIFFYLSLTNLTWSIILIPLFLPTFLVRFYVVGIPSTLLEVAILLVFWRSISTNFSSFRIFQHKIMNLSILLILAGTIIGISTSPNKTEALGWAKAFVIDPILFYAALLLASDQVQDKTKMVWRMLATYTISATVIAIWSLWQYLGGDGFVDFTLTLSPSFFGNPNYLASYLQYGLIFCAGLLCYLIFKRQDNYALRFTLYALLFGSFSALMLTIILTSSLGTLLGLAAAALFLLIKIINPPTRLLTSAFVIIGLAASAILFWQGPRFANLVSQHSSLVTRIGMYQTAINVIRDQPFFGVGLANFTPVYGQYVPDWVPEQTPLLSHNTYLDWWLQLGILGFVGFLLILLIFWQKAVSSQQSAPINPDSIGIKSGSAVSLVLAAALIAFMVHSTIDTLYFKNDYSVTFWMVIGIAYAATRKKN
ncbi:O-antigen ligase family protein [Candidatus Daviesbacteria bacterium]|nr:O-antigen ligase family protein [Candidatus Daviesbacteria bacterium]